MNKKQAIQAAAWLLSIIVTVIAVTAWAQDYGGHVSLNAYVLFPVLGLVAFSLMWGHYVMGTIREIIQAPKDALSEYYHYTGYAVLALICLHPGLLIYQRYRDGYGLPPHSYETYVAPGLGWVTVLGSASLLVFLAYEFRRVFGKRSWWHFVAEAGDVAMLAIFYHGLRIGPQLQSGWFRYVWWFYGLTLIVVLIRSYANKYFLPKQRQSAS